jgi:hypothetical protein
MPPLIHQSRPLCLSKADLANKLESVDRINREALAVILPAHVSQSLSIEHGVFFAVFDPIGRSDLYDKCIQLILVSPFPSPLLLLAQVPK